MSKRWHLNMEIVIGVTESKTSPRHLNFLKQLKKTTEMMPLLRVLFFRYSTSAPQYSNSSKYTIYAHNNQKFGHILLFFCVFLSGSGDDILNGHCRCIYTNTVTLMKVSRNLHVIKQLSGKMLATIVDTVIRIRWGVSLAFYIYFPRSYIMTKK